ncbi:U2AF1 [Cordylochernes scorpioides]|uniref:U2AF1 n=1 Tax=Cordylochernes scorpioides TaxID=51811 RepID=A0ABY6LMU8_9ARAC|nr:U2AF1 [Cordylochernes scorpioides]
MAEYLASIYGTEKDKVNCSFYYKVGACRHGDRCSRIHNKPSFSQTILLQGLYQNPRNALDPVQNQCTLSEDDIQEGFDEFYKDVYLEMVNKYGQVEDMIVCDNLGEHLLGNVYVRFRFEETAEKAMNDLNRRWFGGRPIVAELSPVTDFREACCRQYETGDCSKEGFCNFMHLKMVSRRVKREIQDAIYEDKRRQRKTRNRSRSRSRSRSRDRRRRSGSGERRRR